MRHLPGPDRSTLAIHELGEGLRPTLLCHATGFHGLVWEPYADALGDGFERWSVDFRAHGASVVPEGQSLDWAGFRQDVLTAVDGLALPAGQILGIGHSMGGAALLMAEQERPGTFAGLFLFEPIAPPAGAMPTRPTGSNPMSEAAARRRATFPSAAEALANYAAKPPLNRLRADALDAYVRHGFVPNGEDGSVRLACRPADEAQVFQSAADHTAFTRLGEVACPVVIAVGDEPYGPALFAPSIADALPHGRLERFEQLGHFGPLEAPDRVAAATTAFAADLPGEVPRDVTPHA